MVLQLKIKLVKNKSSRNRLPPISTISQLHYAAKNGNDAMVTSLLNAGGDVDEQDKYGKTALMFAVEGSHETTIAALLNYHANIYAKDKFDKSVLQRVFQLSLTRKAIVAMFMNILKKECLGDSKKLAIKLMDVKCPFYWAILLRDTEVTRILLENGCSINATDLYKPQTALHVALDIRDFANAKLLIEHGADVNAQDFSGYIPLACLCDFDDSDKELEILQILLDRITTWDGNDGYIQLLLILTCGKSKAVKLLLRYPMDWCNEGNDNELTPLHYLIRNPIMRDNLDIIQLFHNKKIAVNSKDHVDINILTSAARSYSKSIVKLLLDKGANPNVRCNKGNTPLLDLCKRRRYIEIAGKIVGLLLQYGADPQIIDRNDFTVFNIIVMPGNFPMARYIIGHLALMEFSNTKLTERIQDDIRSNTCFRDEFKSCKLQLENLQQTIIANSITLFELLNINEKKLAIYARKEDFFKDFSSFDLSTLNPYYFDILEAKYQAVKFRKDRADLICEIMKIRYDSYPVVVDNIIDYVIGYKL